MVDWRRENSGSRFGWRSDCHPSVFFLDDDVCDFALISAKITSARNVGEPLFEIKYTR